MSLGGRGKWGTLTCTNRADGKGQTWPGAAPPSSASTESCTAAATAAQWLALQQSRPPASPSPGGRPAVPARCTARRCPGRARPALAGRGKGRRRLRGVRHQRDRVRVGQSAAAPGRARGRAAAPATGPASAAARSGRRWAPARPASAGSTAPARPAAAARPAGTPGRTCRGHAALLGLPVCPPRARVITEDERRAGRQVGVRAQAPTCWYDNMVFTSSLQTLPA